MMGETSVSVARWQTIFVDDVFDQHTLTVALAMCRRILPVRTTDDPHSLEVLLDDPVRQHAQLQTVRAILADQAARHQLQSPHQADIDAEVIRIVKRVTGGGGVRHE